MALIDELTRRITAELHRTLDQCIRQAVESYVVGDVNREIQPTSGRSQTNGRRGRPRRRAKPSRKSPQDRNRMIMDAVAKVGEATVADVARLTGLDKRGVGSSLYYLAAAGRIKQAKDGKYKISASARAA